MSGAKHLLIVSTECEPGHEEEFHRWYDEVHLRQVLDVPGIDGVRRFERMTGPDSENRFLAVYDVSGEPADVQEGLGGVAFDISPIYLRARTVSRFYRLI